MYFLLTPSQLLFIVTILREEEVFEKAVLMKKILSGAILAGLFTVSAMGGNVLDFQMTSNFSGTMPSGSLPWMDIRITDGSSPGTVSLSISNVNITGSEKVTEFYLNINPAYDVTKLSFLNTGGTPGVTAPLPSLGEDNFKADGDGKYDILFDFSQTPSTAFTAGDYLTYTITGISTLNALDFEFLSTPAGGHGPFDAAAHIQGISATSTSDNGASSGWIAPGINNITVIPTPEPSAAALLAVGAAIIGVVRNRRNSPRS